MRRVETVHTAFQTIEVWKSPTTTEFRVAGAIHAWHHSHRFLTGLAWDLIAASCLLHPHREPASILMLGLAGGTACRTLRHLLPNCHITAIDIDPELIDLAHSHMQLGNLDLEIITTDAYPWLARNKRRFDAVFDDIYLAGKADVFRSRTWDQELLDHLRRALRPDGILGINLVTGPGHRSMQSLTRKAIRTAFPTVRSLRTPDSLNETLVAGTQLARPATLKHYLPEFEHWQDRELWQRIRAEKLQ